jgi:hypothetical protein
MTGTFAKQVQTPDVLGLCEELREVRQSWHENKRELTRLEGVLAKRLEELETARAELAYLREVAVAFAYVAVSADFGLRTTKTLELLRQECNRCRPADEADIKPGFRS